jgi:tetratricopeptide (TPR) repeat protein
MAQSALKQGMYDDALGLLQDAQRLLPDDAELKATVQSVIRQYAKGGSPKKPAVPAAPVNPAVTPQTVTASGQEESVEEIERRIRAEVANEYKQRAQADSASATSREGIRQSVQARASGLDDEVVSPTMADLYFKQGHLKDALRIYEFLLKQETSNAEYLRRVGDIKARLGLETAPAEPGPPPVAPEPSVPLMASVELPQKSEPVPVARSVQPEPVARARPRVSYV